MVQCVQQYIIIYNYKLNIILYRCCSTTNCIQINQIIKPQLLFFGFHLYNNNESKEMYSVIIYKYIKIIKQFIHQ